MNADVLKLINNLEKSQWIFKPDFNFIKYFKIMTRADLQDLKMEKGYSTCKSSGSTGEPVSVEKSYYDFVWFAASNLREIIWRKWDVSKNMATIKPNINICDMNSWGLQAKNQGNVYCMNYQPVSVIQKWLEEKNPHYISCLPSILKQLDLSKISNFIDSKGTGEKGGTNYSSEECGTIAITCPDNKNVYHVMENHIVEVDTDGGLIISTLSNKYIRRYKHGDHIELGTCHCGRSLQTIKTIQGRTRNMFIMPNGDKKWPLIGSLEFDKFGIKRYKAIQVSIDQLELHIIANPLNDREIELIKLVQDKLDSSIKVNIKYVEEFLGYKHEEFVCLISNQ
jgi:phenylacetate-CoA ligase